MARNTKRNPFNKMDTGQINEAMKGIDPRDPENGPILAMVRRAMHRKMIKARQALPLAEWIEHLRSA